jgi:hypothetical protein
METRVNNLGPTGDGKIASDFPIIQYVVAKIWKVTGMNPTVFRLITLMFLVLGLYYIYRIFLLLSRENYGLSILLTALFFTSPILSYYGATFLSDIHAFGTAICGFFYFLKWQKEEKRKWLILSVLVFAMAGLFKMSAAFIFLMALGFYLARLIRIKRHKERKILFKDELINCALLIIPFIPWVLWYGHASAYNEAHPNGFFLVGILPVWDIPMQRVKDIAYFLLHYIFPQMINPYVFGSLVIVSLSLLLLNVKKILNETILRLIIVFGVYAGFILLFYQVFEDHDYYMLNMMNALVLITAVLVERFTNEEFIQKHQKPIMALLFILVVTFTYTTGIKTRTRIDYTDVWGTKEFVYSKVERDFMAWTTWNDRTRFGVLEDKSIDWKKIGIGENDIIFVAGDYTINRSLYLMNRRGFTTYNTSGLEGIPQCIEIEKKKSGLKFLVVIEPDWRNSPVLQPYINRLIFAKDNLYVYQLQ